MNGFDRSEGWDDGYDDGVKAGRQGRADEFNALIAELELILKQHVSMHRTMLGNAIARHKRAE